MRTPSQTVGPFFALGLRDRPCPEGPVRLEGRVLDGAGEGVPDALVEVWSPQAGWGRCGTDAEGRYAFSVRETAHLDVQVFARGLLKQVRTRVVFEPGETAKTFDVRLQDDAFYVA
ncbi:MAG TPA: carboxypeptidase regulatory-like domain-containing protein [Gaiellaceae bacterium]|nr:carboxypeptidase regulatory-like domain-containing protein [Gaiellaceae bacterium]